MKTSLDGLPRRARRDLEKAVHIVQVEFAEAIEKDPKAKADAELLKIILYGSYARGDQVESWPLDGYQSDYDLLVIVNKEEYAEYVTLSGAEEWFHKLIYIPVSLEAHGLDFFNHALSRHRSFFIDVFKDGIVLFEKPGHPFVAPPPMTPELAYDLAKEHYEVWFRDGLNAWKTLLDEFSVGDAHSGHLAVTLHRRAEELYNAVLLVLSFYSPGGHDMDRLRDMAEALDDRLAAAWPRNTQAERRRFDRFKRAFLNDTTQEIHDYSAKEVAWIAERVEHLDELAGTICRERLAELAKAAGES
jgi:predicted nucleotidyltransferase